MSKSSDEFLRQEINKRNGIPENAPTSIRPISGYLRHPDINSGIGSMPNEIEAQGDIEVILKKEVAGRTSFSRGDQMKTGGRAVPLNSDDDDLIFDAIANADGKKAKSTMADAFLGLLRASTEKNASSVTKSKKKNSSGEYVEGNEIFEAQILGGFEIDDIDGISYSYNRLVSDSADAEIADIGLMINPREIAQQEEIDESEVREILKKYTHGIPDTPSLKDLKIYRKAQQIRDKYESAGINYVLFERPDGKSIDDPKTYDKNANVIDGVEKTILNKIKREVSAIVAKESQASKKVRTEQKGNKGE